MSKKHVPNRILTDAFREIKYTLSRFLSLFLLSALAVAFLSGLRTTAPDMEHTADDYYDRTHLMDVRVLSTLGLTEEDIDVLSAQEGVSAAEGAWYVDATLHAAENDYIVRFHSLSEAGINEPEVVDGRLPEADDECVVEPELLTTLGLSLGDTITLDMEGTSYEDSLHTNTYTVVGTVNSSLYMSTDRGTSTVGTGRLTAVAFLPREAFDLDYYTEAYLLMEGGEALLCYDDEYQDRVDELIDALEPLGEERAANRYDEVIQEATDELNDAQQEYDQAAADAQQQLADGEQELADARAELDDGWQQYYDGVADLAEAKATLPGELADAEQELKDAKQELDDGYQELLDGEQEYADGKAEAEEELSDARQKLNDARREVAEIEDCKWYILDRDTNVGYVSYQQDAERMGNLASVFPLIFFLVAALVCLTTMTRMVEDQRVEIGGLKALGYSRSAIALKYVGYGFLSSFFGGILGLALGVTIIPTIIFNAWKVLYTVGDMELFLLPDVALLSVGAAVLCVTGTAFATCFAALAAVPAQLMRPKSPKPGRRVLLERIRPLWKRMSFTWKVTIRNLFRYKKRFWMTVIGIGGCTALIITGFGVRNSLYDVFDKQYDEITPYSAQISLKDDVTDDELTEIAAVLDDSELVSQWMAVSSQPVTAESGSRSLDSNVYLFTVSDQEQFSRFVHLRHRLDGDGVSLSQEGAVITEKLADMLDVGVGDTITLVDGDNRRAEVTITDLTENYVFHYLYITEECYESLFGHASEINSLMVTYTDDTEENSDAVAEQLIPLSGVSSVSRIENTKNTFIEGMKGVDYAVVIITVSAAALAFVVLFNLTNINITERMRELATLKVLGFYTGELNAYIYRENIFLTIFGILLGLVLGKFLHQWLIITVEIDMVMFGRDAGVMSYVYAAVLTALFSFLVNVISRKKLKKIDMVESLKTVD